MLRATGLRLRGSKPARSMTRVSKISVTPVHLLKEGGGQGAGGSAV